MFGRNAAAIVLHGDSYACPDFADLNLNERGLLARIFNSVLDQVLHDGVDQRPFRTELETWFNILPNFNSIEFFQAAEVQR